MTDFIIWSKLYMYLNICIYKFLEKMVQKTYLIYPYSDKYLIYPYIPAKNIELLLQCQNELICSYKNNEYRVLRSAVHDGTIS